MAVRLTCTDNATGHDGLRWRMGPDSESVTFVVGETAPGVGELVVDEPFTPEACFSVVAYSGEEEGDAAEVCAETGVDPFEGVAPGTYMESEGGYFTAVMLDENDEKYGLITAPFAGGSQGSSIVTWQTAMDWCEALELNGFSDWRLPTLDERIMEYRAYKPSTNNSNTSSGATDRVDPPLGNYTSSDPSQTSLPEWQSGGTDAFNASSYWSATESSPTNAWRVSFSTGSETSYSKTSLSQVRAVRRVYF